MKTFLKILPIITWLLTPTIVSAVSCSDHSSDTACASDSNCKWENGACVEKCPTVTDGDTTTCQHQAGCYFDATAEECTPCPALTFNDGTSNTCSHCAVVVEGEYITDYQHGDYGRNAQTYHKVFDEAHANDTGLTSCPWRCANNFFQLFADGQNGGNECSPCPNPTSNTYFITIDTANSNLTGGAIDTNIYNSCNSQCQNDDFIIKTTTIQNGSNATVYKYYCGQCGAGQESIDPSGIAYCTCFDGANEISGTPRKEADVSEGSPQHRYECQCPSHSFIYGVAGISSSEHGYCQCDESENYRMTQVNGTNVCTQCAGNAYAYTSGSTTHCACKSGYYGEIDGTCTQCPAGTTSAGSASNTTRADCHVSCNTKFYVNNNYYMRFIPSVIGTCTVTNAATGEVQSRLDQSQGIPR